MILAQEAANDKGGIQILDFGELEPPPWRTGTFAVCRKIAATQAEIDVLGAEATDHFIQQRQLFKRGVRRSKCPDGISTTFLDHILQAMGNVVEGNVPLDFTQLTVNTDHRRHARRQV